MCTASPSGLRAPALPVGVAARVRELASTLTLSVSCIPDAKPIRLARSGLRGAGCVLGLRTFRLDWKKDQ